MAVEGVATSGAGVVAVGVVTCDVCCCRVEFHGVEVALFCASTVKAC